MKWFVSAALIVGLVSIASTAARAETVEKRAPADARGQVEIVNVSGDVQVIGWDRAEVEVNAELDSGVERLNFSSKERRTVIEVELQSGRSRNGSSDLIVRVPRDSSLSINTVSAEQTIQGVRGAQRLQAVSGSITTETWGAEFEAQSVSGEITVRGHGGGGSFRVTNVSGDVRLADIGPDLELETVTGDMDVRMDELRRARIKTTNGNLDLKARLSKDARLDAEAINGDLTMLFAAPVNAEFDIETFNGDILNCFGPKSRRTREYAPGNELQFSEGAPGARVRIQTLNGGVEICKK